MTLLIMHLFNRLTLRAYARHHRLEHYGFGGAAWTGR